MKTREEIEQEFNEGCRAVWAAHAISAAEAAELDALAEKRKAALAELDDPMARLIAAAKKALSCPFLYPVMQGELRDAIDYAEQRRAQG